MSVGVCIVGSGRAGSVHAVNIHRHLAQAHVVAVVDADPAKADSLAGQVGGPPTFASLAAALESVPFDAVVIATPTFTHCSLAVEAAAHGVHVFCEKPMALLETECRDMIRAAKEGGAIMQIGFVRRFQPEFVEARARVEAGEIGEPMVIKSLTHGPGLPPVWAHELDRSNGMLAEVNSHDYDCVRWLVGSDIVRVYAEVSNRKGKALGVTAGSFYDNAVVALRFADETIGTIDGTCPADYGYDARVEITGSKGLLMIGEAQGLPLLMCVDRAKGGRRPVHKTWPERFAWGYVNEISSFVECVITGSAPRVGGIDGLRAVQAVRASNQSWIEGRPIELRGGDD
jgi:scyllo-inositol 2-dehydrogenase (NAD+)